MVNGSDHETSDITQGEGLGLGVTIDNDNDPVVVIWVMVQGQPVGVSLTADAARHLSAVLVEMAGEVDRLEANLGEMSQEAVETEIRRIAERLNEEHG